MDVELSDWAQTRIEELVASGRASCAREAIDFALAAWDARERETEALLDGQSDEWWAELKARVQEGIDAADAGDLHPFTPELFEDVKRRGRERLRERNARHA